MFAYNGTTEQTLCVYMQTLCVYMCARIIIHANLCPAVGTVLTLTGRGEKGKDGGDRRQETGREGKRWEVREGEGREGRREQNWEYRYMCNEQGW